MDRSATGLHYVNMQGIPTYALYGEIGSDRQQDWLHWEPIQTRARLHDYRIVPHRHEHLFQLLYLTGGTGRATLDGRECDLGAGDLVVVPALTVHGYTFSADVGGMVVTLLERDVRTVGLPAGDAAVLPASGEIVGALGRLVSEADAPGARHDLAMRAHIALLTLLLHRAGASTTSAAGLPDTYRQHADAFRQMVDTRFRETRRIADYARALGISHTHLNRICRAVLGASAQAVIEQRVRLEARRQLQFSSLTIKQIGAELGYDDPAYFTRLVTRLLGVAPTAFRRRMRG